MNEFASGASEWPSDLSRREFLRLSGATVALAGLGACTKQPIEKIVPHAKQPPEMTPGKPLHFASATTFNGYAQGILVTSREGRPIKIEGNPDHPESLGASNVFMQASLLSLYDPDRAKVVTERNAVSTWGAFQSDFSKAIAAKRQNKGAGLRVLTETITGPTLLSQLQDFVKSFPEARWHRYDPVPRDGAADGANLAFGRKLEPIYNYLNDLPALESAPTPYLPSTTIGRTVNHHLQRSVGG